MGRSTDLLGLAGSDLVAPELCLQRYEVAATGRGAKRTDLLAQRADGSSFAIQVKTRSSGDFDVGSGALDASPEDADEWFVLVNCPTGDEWPSFNIVPRNHLVAAARVFQAWMESEGKGWPRKLLGEPEFAGYREAWELMQIPAREAAWRMLEWVTNGLREYPQPDLGLDGV